MKIKDIIVSIAAIDKSITAILVLGALSLIAYIISVPYLPPKYIALVLAGISILVVGLALLIVTEARRTSRQPDTVSTVASQDAVEYVGYFYTEADGFEHILVSQVAGSVWDFPIRGFVRAGASPQHEITSAIAACDTSDLTRHSMYGAGFYSPEIIPIYEKDSLQVLQDAPTILKYLVKVRLAEPVRIQSGDGGIVYSWYIKHPLFRSRTPNGPSPSEAAIKDLSIIRMDKISREFGLNVLECVDILVFREVADKDREFLLLHRKNRHEARDGWEYPKGGLEYHETTVEGGVRELLEETGVESVGDFRFGGDLGVQSPRVLRTGKPYNALRVHGITYLFVGDGEQIESFVRSRSEEHNDCKWVILEEARTSLWMKEYDYGPRFFARWALDENDILRRIANPVSIAFQITETCGHGCRYCLRRIAHEKSMAVDRIKGLIDELSSRKILMLTFTGGEPLEYGKHDLMALIEYAHQKRIHTTLSTTGISSDGVAIAKRDLVNMDRFLDHLLLSVDCLSDTVAKRLYTRVDDWRLMFDKAAELARWSVETSIVLEVCTVATKQNIGDILSVGKWLFGINPNAYWKIDEYYYNGPMQQSGRRSDVRSLFELSAEEFADLRTAIHSDPVLGSFARRRIRFNTKESRRQAPDVMITPQGNLVGSADNEYVVRGDITAVRSWRFANRRPYKEYRDYCRLWDWESALVM